MHSRCTVLALLLAGCLPGLLAQTATGRLQVSGVVQASYHVEAKGETHTALADGTAGRDLQLTVSPGPLAVRVLKANSSSRTYSLVLRGTKEDLRIRDLPYATTITAVVPDSPSGQPLTMSVIPD